MTAKCSTISLARGNLQDKNISGAGPDRGIVSQAPSLFPWLTAFKNVSLGVNKFYPHATKTEREDIVEYYINRVGLGHSLFKKTGELSDGIRHRSGITRTFTRRQNYYYSMPPLEYLTH